MLRSGFDLERRETISEFPKSVERTEQAETEAEQKIKIKVRFDYKGIPRPARFFIGGKNSKDVAEDLRQQQAALWRNVPIQGVRIDDLEFLEPYAVYDEYEESSITYAPLELKATLDSLEDLVRFVGKAEFRRIEILEPAKLALTGKELERLFYKFGELLQGMRREQEMR
jgi:hypothetical protein